MLTGVKESVLYEPASRLAGTQRITGLNLLKDIMM